MSDADRVSAGRTLQEAGFPLRMPRFAALVMRSGERVSAGPAWCWRSLRLWSPMASPSGPCGIAMGARVERAGAADEARRVANRNVVIGGGWVACSETASAGFAADRQAVRPMRMEAALHRDSTPAGRPKPLSALHATTLGRRLSWD